MFCCKWSLLCGTLLVAAVVGLCRPRHDDLDLNAAAETPVASQTVVYFERLPGEAREQLVEQSLCEIRACSDLPRFLPKECERQDHINGTGLEAYETGTVLSPTTGLPEDREQFSKNTHAPVELQEAAGQSERRIVR